MKRIPKIFTILLFVYAFLFICAVSLHAELIEPTRSLKGEGEEMGKLSVSSEPPGLAVTLDGSDLGKTPLIGQDVKSGDHVLTVKDSEVQIYVFPGKTLNLSWFKGSFIEIPEKKLADQPQPKGETKEHIDKKKPADTAAKEEENLRPIYWPLNPRGPIY